MQQGVLPDGVDALVTYLHHEQHVGFERAQVRLRGVLGIDLSEGGAVSILERAGTAAQLEVAAIREQVRQSAMIGSDETSAWVNGCNWWEIMGSLRSDWGLRAYAALATVINTAKYCGEIVFAKLVNLMGKPVVHYLVPSIA